MTLPSCALVVGSDEGFWRETVTPLLTKISSRTQLAWASPGAAQIGRPRDFISCYWRTLS